MKKIPVFVLVICFLPLITQSCDNSFSPSGPEESKMVVYSVLTTESDVQYVRVYSNYYPAENNPANNTFDSPVTDAQVSISDGTTTYVFHDTLVAREDTSKYTEPIFIYIANGFRAVPGATYELMVSSPTHGVVTSKTRVPTSSSLSNLYTYLYERPYNYSNLTPQVSFTLSPYTSAYKVKFYIEYEADTPEGRKTLRFEVPETIHTLSCFFEIYDLIYPRITRRLNVGISNQTPQSTQYFSYFSYRRSVEFVYQQNSNPIFKKVVFYNVQFDENWYRYYATARTFQDRFSVRLDEPDFTNLQNGVGLFGSMTIDSTSSPLPEAILWPFGGTAPPSYCN